MRRRSNWGRTPVYRTPEERATMEIAIPEETTVKPMTQGPNGSKVTIGDIFKHRHEAALTAKMMRRTKNDREFPFQQILDKLLIDQARPRAEYGWGPDIRHRPRAKYGGGPDIRQGWTITLEEFMDLTPFYKAFFHGCTRGSMRLLLLQSRRDMVQLQTKDPKTFQRKKTRDDRNSSGEGRNESIAGASLGRLSPLDKAAYSEFFSTLALRRLGCIVNAAVNLYINTERAYRGYYFIPEIKPNRIDILFHFSGTNDERQKVVVTKANCKEVLSDAGVIFSNNLEYTPKACNGHTRSKLARLAVTEYNQSTRKGGR